MKKTFEIVNRDGKYYVVDCDDGRVIYTYGHTKWTAENKLRKLTVEPSIYGWGYNDAEYATQSKVNGKCPFYSEWKWMLRRCHSPAFQEEFPTYKDCRVCEEWRYFSNFKAWMEKQDWQGKHLDKDIIGNGKLYSPAMCCFVDGALNLLMVDRKNHRGPYPVGVSEHGQGFQARCSRGNGSEPFGTYPTVRQAFYVYVKVKTEYVKEVTQDCEQRIKEGFGRFCERLWKEYNDYSCNTQHLKEVV